MSIEQKQEQEQLKRDLAIQFHTQAKEMGKLMRDIIVALDDTRTLSSDDLDFGHLGIMNAAQIDIENALAKLKGLS